MDSIVHQVQALADKADAEGRSQILITLRDLQYNLEEPTDTFLRLYNSVATPLFF